MYVCILRVLYRKLFKLLFQLIRIAWILMYQTVKCLIIKDEKYPYGQSNLVCCRSMSVKPRLLQVNVRQTSSVAGQCQANLVCCRSMSVKPRLLQVNVRQNSSTTCKKIAFTCHNDEYLLSNFALYSMMWQVKISHDKSTFRNYQSDCPVVWK